MRIRVTRIASDGSLLRRMVDTSSRSDAERWEDLVDRAELDVPPPYQPVAGAVVYQISAGDRPVMVTQHRLSGPLEELVAAVMAEGDPAHE